MAEGGMEDIVSHEDEESLRHEIGGSVISRHFKFTRSLSEMSEVPNGDAPPPGNLRNITSQTFYRARACSLKKLRTLQEIFLADLVVGKHHLGNYLTLRTVHRQHESSGRVSSIIVEDTVGKLAIFLLLNVANPIKPVIYINDLLLDATVFCLKEPHCTESKSGDCVLVCESPTDVVVINETHPRFQPLQKKWKLKRTPTFLRGCDQKSAASVLGYGGALLAAKDFQAAAVRLFLIAENVGVEDDVLEARSGLCKAYFGQELYEEALTYAKMILCQDPKNASALKCAAECHYNLEQYKEAVIELGKFRAIHPDDSSMNDLFEKASRLQTEAETGKYDMREMFNASTLHPGTSIECGDYLGPVKDLWSGQICKGLFTTKKVQPGTLLMVSKALAYLRIGDADEDPGERADSDAVEDLGEYASSDVEDPGESAGSVFVKDPCEPAGSVVVKDPGEPAGSVVVEDSSESAGSDVVEDSSESAGSEAFENPSESAGSDTVEYPSKSMEFPAWRNLAGVLLQKIWKYPQKYAETIYKLELLDAGETFTEETSWGLEETVDTESNEKVIVVNVQKIMDIVVKNYFGVGASFKNVNAEFLRNSGCENAYGIFQAASFTKHSCMPNASALVFNDVMFIRATRVIEMNEEVFISHMSWRNCYHTRELFFSVRGFKCKCKLCNKYESLNTFEKHVRDVNLKDCKRVYKETAEVENPHAGGSLQERWRRVDSQMLKAFGVDLKFPYLIEFSIVHDCKAAYLADNVSVLPRNERLDLELQERKSALDCFGFNETELLGALRDGLSLIPNDSFLDENVLYTISRIIELNHILDNAGLARDWVRILVELENVYSGGGHLDVMRVKYSNIIDLFIG